MSEAFKLAEKAFSLDEVPVGAIIVCFDRIIGKGYNQCESLNDPTAHAEILAITAAASTLDNWRLNKCTIYVTKEPCTMCAGAIITLGWIDLFLAHMMRKKAPADRYTKFAGTRG